MKASQEAVITLPVGWVMNLLDQIPTVCALCGKKVPSTEMNGNKCDSCVRVKKSAS